MAEHTPVPSELLDSAKQLITRRRLLRQGGASGIALTALYAAPSFTSFGPNKAYASITGGSTLCISDLCDSRKPGELTMIYTGDPGAGSNSQTGSKAPVISGDPGGASPVTMKGVKKDDTGIAFRTFTNVAAGGSFVLHHADDDHSHPHLGAETRLLICNPENNEVL